MCVCVCACVCVCVCVCVRARMCVYACIHSYVLCMNKTKTTLNKNTHYCMTWPTHEHVTRQSTTWRVRGSRYIPLTCHSRNHFQDSLECQCFAVSHSQGQQTFQRTDSPHICPPGGGGGGGGGIDDAYTVRIQFGSVLRSQCQI